MLILVVVANRVFGYRRRRKASLYERFSGVWIKVSMEVKNASSESVLIAERGLHVKVSVWCAVARTQEVRCQRAGAAFRRRVEPRARKGKRLTFRY